MNPEIIKNIKMLQKDPDFTLEKLERTSQASKQIGDWFKCVIEVYDKL